MIRTTTIADAAAIANIQVASWRAAYQGIMPSDVLANLSVAEREVRFREAINRNPDEFLVVANEDEIVGFVGYGCFRDQPDEPTLGEIRAIYLLKSHWGKGLGTELLEAALNNMSKQGYQKVFLWVLAANKRALVFYRRHGFQLGDARKQERFGAAILEESRMSKSLRV